MCRSWLWIWISFFSLVLVRVDVHGYVLMVPLRDACGCGCADTCMALHAARCRYPDGDPEVEVGQEYSREAYFSFASVEQLH